jgi:hypothetical protein
LRISPICRFRQFADFMIANSANLQISPICRFRQFAVRQFADFANLFMGANFANLQIS